MTMSSISTVWVLTMNNRRDICCWQGRHVHRNGMEFTTDDWLGCTRCYIRCNHLSLSKANWFCSCGGWCGSRKVMQDPSFAWIQCMSFSSHSKPEENIHLGFTIHIMHNNNNMIVRVPCIASSEHHFKTSTLRFRLMYIIRAQSHLQLHGMHSYM